MASIKSLLIAVFFILLCAPMFSTTIAFDLTKSETAGNADWTIGTSPNWTGAYSDYGLALRNMGYQTIILTGSSITANQLANVDVLIIPEAQDPFTTTEKTAILNFVNTGGGLFLIADHDGSDRNNNGWDSRRVYNESLSSGTNFGITFDANSLYADPTSLIESPVTPLTNGLTQVGMYAGCSITPTSGAICHIWLRNSSEEGLVTRIYGQGKVAAYGDSSPFDDGTGNSGNELYDGWNDYDNATLGTNVVSWLLGATTNPVTFSNVIVIPAQPRINQQIEIRATINSPQALSLTYLYWKTTGAFHPVSMSLLSGNIYRGFIPAQSTAGNVLVYLQAITTNNLIGYYPEGAPANLMTIAVAPTPAEDDLAALLPFLAYPNPYNPGLIPLSIKSMPGSTISIYNTKGILIDHFESGSSISLWDGRDKSGNTLPAGIYLINSRFANEVKTSKILLTN